MASSNYDQATRRVTAARSVLDLASNAPRNWPAWVSDATYPMPMLRAATYQRFTTGGPFGAGFTRFLPGSFSDGNRGEHYCGVGQVHGFDAVGDSSRLVCGLMIRFGSTFFTDQIENGTMKQLIFINDTGQRPMMLPKGNSLTRVMAPCDGTLCMTGVTPDGTPDWHNDYNNQPDIKLGQWLWIEFAVNSNLPVTSVKTWSEDGELVGEPTYAPWASPGRVTTMDICGFLNSIPVQGAEPWYDLERIEFAVGRTAELTPPAGFPGSTRGASVREGVELTPELENWTKPNATTLRSPDGETEIGDAMQETFYPQFKKKKWANESNFSIRPVFPDYSPDRLQTDRDTVVYRKGIYTCRLRAGTWETPRGTRSGSEFVIAVASRPPVDYLDFTVNTRNAVMTLQRPLHAGPTDTDQILDEEIAPGVVRRKTRFVQYINSIYVEHPTRRGNQYGDGTQGYLHRPKMTDALGVETWGDWQIISPVLIRMVFATSAWDSAAYPVRIG